MPWAFFKKVPWPPEAKKSGFTLIELILAITILFMAVAAVFYFYSQSLEHQAKLKERYRVLRIGKQFVDSYIFSTDPEKLTMTDGKREVEDFILQWNVYPVEDEREVIFTSGVLPLAQLKRVHLEIIKKTTGKSVLDLHFLVNTISPPE
jgi:prepilin-type N-terminal cleavage/methylation domain-containing protein